MPSRFNAGQISFKILFCRFEHKSTLSGDHSLAASGSLRNSPSPEQGASTTMTSKKAPRRWKSLGSLLVTTEFGQPHFIMFSSRIGTCDLITSFETRRLSFDI